MENDLADPGTDSMQPTRQSLLSRLRNVEDQEGWREFFETYWLLIYNVARRAGLNDLEAQEVVQNTFIYLSRRMPKFKYDRALGSFKSWLRVVTRSRIHVHRRTQRREAEWIQEPQPGSQDQRQIDALEALPDLQGDALDAVWQKEWEENLLNAAFRRLRTRVSAQQLLIYRLAIQGEYSLGQVAKKLGVGVAQVYLTRHRVGKLIKAEVHRLRQETE